MVHGKKLRLLSSDVWNDFAITRIQHFQHPSYTKLSSTMAKSTRATNKKRNRAKLRATIFGPADEARTSRLSAKLQELADQPKPTQDGTGMEVDSGNYRFNGIIQVVSDHLLLGKPEDIAQEPGSTTAPTTMDIDDKEGTTKDARRKSSSRPSRIEKKIMRRKAKSSIVFRSETARHKRMSSKKRQK